MVRRMQYAGLVLLFQLAAACSPEPSAKKEADAPSPSATAAADARLVLAFGDSLYAGYNLPQQEGLAPELQRQLASLGVTADVRNGGVSGDTSAAGLQRLAFTLDGLPRKPDLVIVGLGANDMLRGLPVEECEANLRAILTELQKRGIPSMLTGMLASRNMGPDYARRFDAIYPALSREFGVPLYPFLLDGVVSERELLLEDGLHPNEQGVDHIAKGLAPTVAETLKSDT